MVGFRIALFVHVPFGMRQRFLERLIEVSDSLPPIPLASLYSEIAIMFLATISQLFHLPLRQTEGATKECPNCGGLMVRRGSERGQYFLCLRYPACPSVEAGAGTVLARCPECGQGVLLPKTVRKGRMKGGSFSVAPAIPTAPLRLGTARPRRCALTVAAIWRSGRQRMARVPLFACVLIVGSFKMP